MVLLCRIIKTEDTEKSEHLVATSPSQSLRTVYVYWTEALTKNSADSVRM